MYFSSLVKQELAQIMPQDILEQKGELLSFVRFKGRIDIKNKVLTLNIENPVMIKVVYFLFKKVFQYEVLINPIKKRKNKKTYLITVPNSEKTRYILDTFNLTADTTGRIIERGMFINKKGKFFEFFSPKGFLRGAFLAEGFVNDPERMYHLEISCHNKDQAKAIANVLQSASFSSKISLWQKRWSVYIKKNEQIFEFLRFIGVQRALLNLQDIIARKDLLNTINRLVNCETANLDKTISSASRQLSNIDVVKRRIGLESLSPNLVDVINARLENPYSSLQELAEIVGGGITKSGIYHRLKKIELLAENYLNDETSVNK